MVILTVFLPFVLKTIKTKITSFSLHSRSLIFSNFLEFSFCTFPLVFTNMPKVQLHIKPKKFLFQNTLYAKYNVEKITHVFSFCVHAIFLFPLTLHYCLFSVNIFCILSTTITHILSDKLCYIYLYPPHIMIIYFYKISIFYFF